jgi:hypothetical protein
MAVIEANLGDDVKVGDQCALEDDWDVTGVEEFDGIARVLATIPGRLDGQIHTETLQTKTDKVRKNELKIFCQKT